MDDGDHLDEGVGKDGEGVDGGALVVAPARQLPCVLINNPFILLQVPSFNHFYHLNSVILNSARQLPCVLIHHSCHTILICLLVHLSIISIISILL